MNLKNEILHSLLNISLFCLAVFLWRLGVAKGSIIINFFLVNIISLVFLSELLSFFKSNYSLDKKWALWLRSPKAMMEYEAKDFLSLVVIFASIIISIDQVYVANSLDAILRFSSDANWILDWLFHSVFLFAILLTMKIVGVAISSNSMKYSGFWAVVMYLIVAWVGVK